MCFYVAKVSRNSFPRNSDLTGTLGKISHHCSFNAKKCLFIFGSNKNMHYFCRDKMSIHPLK